MANCHEDMIGPEPECVALSLSGVALPLDVLHEDGDSGSETWMAGPGAPGVVPLGVKPSNPGWARSAIRGTVGRGVVVSDPPDPWIKVRVGPLLRRRLCSV